MDDRRKYTEHDLETVQRLTGVETRLEVVESVITDFRSHNDRRLDELHKMLIDHHLKQRGQLGRFLTKNWKYLVTIVAAILGIKIII